MANIKSSTHTPKNLCELIGENPGAFERFLQQKKRILAEMEEATNKRALESDSRKQDN
jgi:hypothetical protein